MTISAADYIRNRYKVPAKRGGRIRYTGDSDGPRLATIVGFTTDSAYLRIRFDGERKIHNAHPTWEIEYLTSEQ